MAKQLQNTKLTIRLSAEVLRSIEKLKGKNKSHKVKKVLTAGINRESIDNADYTELSDALFELKKEIAPIGSNLNQLVRYLHQGNDEALSHIRNLDVLDELQLQFKEWIKLMKSLERKINARA